MIQDNTKLIAILEFSGNPNGERDNDNAPRVDEAGFGVTTDACISRKIRDVNEKDPSKDDVFVTRGGALSVKAKALFDTGCKTQEDLFKRYADVRCFGLTRGKDDFSEGAKKDKIHYRWNSKGAAIIKCRSAVPIAPEQRGIGVCYLQSPDDEKSKESTLGSYWNVNKQMYIVEIDISKFEVINGRVDQAAMDFLINGLIDIDATNVGHRQIICHDIGILTGSHAKHGIHNHVSWKQDDEVQAFGDKYEFEISDPSHKFFDSKLEVIEEGCGYLSNIFS